MSPVVREDFCGWLGSILGARNFQTMRQPLGWSTAMSDVAFLRTFSQIAMISFAMSSVSAKFATSVAGSGGPLTAAAGTETDKTASLAPETPLLLAAAALLVAVEAANAVTAFVVAVAAFTIAAVPAALAF